MKGSYSSTSKEKLVAMENGIVVDYKPEKTGVCVSLLHNLKVILYLEVVILLGFFFCALIYTIPLEASYHYDEMETQKNSTDEHDDPASLLQTANDLTTGSTTNLDSNLEDILSTTSGGEPTSADSETSKETENLVSGWEDRDYNYLKLGQIIFRWHTKDDLESEEEKEEELVNEEEEFPHFNPLELFFGHPFRGFRSDEMTGLNDEDENMIEGQDVGFAEPINQGQESIVSDIDPNSLVNEDVDGEKLVNSVNVRSEDGQDEERNLKDEESNIVHLLMDNLLESDSRDDSKANENKVEDKDEIDESTKMQQFLQEMDINNSEEAGPTFEMVRPQKGKYLSEETDSFNYKNSLDDSSIPSVDGMTNWDNYALNFDMPNMLDYSDYL